MDEGIGVMEELRRTGLEENTLFVFTSENGGERFSDSWPLIGGKIDLTEGGIRVPLIVHWPNAVSLGRISSRINITMDWAATMVEAAGGAAHPDYPFDGESLLPVLRGEGRRHRSGTFLAHEVQVAESYAARSMEVPRHRQR